MLEFRTIDGNCPLPIPARVPSDPSAIVVCTTKPTPQASAELQSAFTTYNENLFGSTLPEVLITLRASYRHHGYFAPRRFIAGDSEHCHEIALNSAHFGNVRVTLQTLVHEMAHLWQQCHGKPPRRNYHDRQWAAKMVSIGLIPSDTGLPGGKQTGQRMLDYVAENGLFARVTDALIESGFTITWADAVHANPTDVVHDNPKTGAGGKHQKVTCRHCGFSQQVTLSARIVCGFCHPDIEPMVEAAP
jgi:predicted SprT family Zn-dependent metalloprotease